MYKIKLDKFEGPLDLLLKLIEEEELDITEVSLAKVTEQYLHYLEEVEDLPTEELADFLVIATKLLLIKSKILLPTLSLDEEEGDLEKQLKIYRIFYEASKKIQKMISKKRFAYFRESSKLKTIEPIFSPPRSVNPASLGKLFQGVLERIEPLIQLPKEMIKKTVSIQEKIKEIKKILFQESSVNFKIILEKAKNKTEIIVTFLALLELIKKHSVQVIQENIFDDIHIKSSPEKSLIN